MCLHYIRVIQLIACIYMPTQCGPYSPTHDVCSHAIYESVWPDGDVMATFWGLNENHN